MARGFKSYSVYVKESAENPLEKAVFVREGFSFWAFILTLFWAAYYRIWPLCGIIMAVLALLYALSTQGVISEEQLEVLRVAFYAWVGFEAPDWRGYALKRQGYVLYDVTCAGNIKEAGLRFFTAAQAGQGA